MRLTIDESCDSFRELRESGAYYADKTSMLKHYLADNFKSVVLFAWPHRFGKTLTMTMFRDFLDVRQNSRGIFAGLEIMEHPDVVDRFMNRYPVVFISLKEVSGSTFDTVLRRLSAQVSDLFGRHRDLLESDAVSRERKVPLLRFYAEAEDQVHLEKSLDYLSQILAAHYHRPAFVIVDEYDVPMAKALGSPFYEQVADMVEHMLSYVCKTNDSVRAVLLSGCLYTVRNSAYTGVNNIIPYTVLSANYATSIGFTDEDVRRLLDDAGIPEHAGVVEERYDGYVFGRDKMFCPWDALRYVASVLDGSYDADQGPQSHWVNTSSTSLNLIHGFLGKAPNAVEGLERLMAGETIDCVVTDNLPYHTIREGGENLWCALLETGYLTKAVRGRPTLMPLCIPNKSVQLAFRQEVWSFFKDRLDNVFVRDLVCALWAGETALAQEALDQILEATMSFCHEYHEYSHHLILSGNFYGNGISRPVRDRERLREKRSHRM